MRKYASRAGFFFASAASKGDLRDSSRKRRHDVCGPWGERYVGAALQSFAGDRLQGMRNYRVWVLVSIMLFLVSCRSATPTRGVYNELLVKASREFDDAIRTGDFKRAQSMLAPDYQMHWEMPKTAGTNPQLPAAPRLSADFNPLAKIAGGKMESTIYYAYSYDKIGVVLSTYLWEGQFNDDLFRHRGRLTDVWMFLDGRWKLLASTSQTFPICDPMGGY
jgi:hypothetical protein